MFLEELRRKAPVAYWIPRKVAACSLQILVVCANTSLLTWITKLLFLMVPLSYLLNCFPIKFCVRNLGPYDRYYFYGLYILVARTLSLILTLCIYFCDLTSDMNILFPKHKALAAQVHLGLTSAILASRHQLVWHLGYPILPLQVLEPEDNSFSWRNLQLETKEEKDKHMGRCIERIQCTIIYPESIFLKIDAII